MKRLKRFCCDEERMGLLTPVRQTLAWGKKRDPHKTPLCENEALGREGGERVRLQKDE